MSYSYGQTAKLPPHIADQLRKVGAENTRLTHENRELHRLNRAHQERTAELHDANGSLETANAELLAKLADAERLASALRAQVKLLMAVPVDHRKPEAVCGTHSAYQRHIRAGERPCYPCKSARAIYQREYRERKTA